MTLFLLKKTTQEQCEHYAKLIKELKKQLQSKVVALKSIESKVIALKADQAPSNEEGKTTRKLNEYLK